MPLNEFEYGILFDDSDFVLLLIRKHLKTLREGQEKQFCKLAVEAIRQYRQNNLRASLSQWLKVINDQAFSEVGRSIARIKYFRIRQELSPSNKARLEKSIESEYTKLDDVLAFKIYKSQVSEKAAKGQIEIEIAKQLANLEYQALSRFVRLMSTGHTNFVSPIQESNTYKAASAEFMRIGAIDTSHHALAMYYLSLIEQDAPRKAATLVRKAALEFKKGKAMKMYLWLLGDYYNKLGNLSQKTKNKVKHYKMAVNYLSQSDERDEYLIALGNYHYSNSGTKKGSSDVLSELTKAEKYFKEAKSKKELAKIRGVIQLRIGTLKNNLTESIYHFKKASDYFKKSGNTKSFHHVRGLYYYALHATTTNMNTKLRYLKLASRYYKLADISDGHHKTVGLLYAFKAHYLVHDIGKKNELYRMAANEFRSAGWLNEYYNALGYHYYVSALLSRKDSIEFFFKSARYFKKVGNKLSFDAVGQASLMVAMLTRSRRHAEIAIEFFTKASNEDMLLASKMLLYEIMAQEETDEGKKRQYYLQSATNLREFTTRLAARDNRPVAGLPEDYVIPNIGKKLDAQYEHLMGLASEGNEKEEHFRKSEQHHQHFLTIDGNDKVSMHSYGLLLRDWKKYDESRTIFKKLVSRYPDNTGLTKEFELAENLLIIDYKRTKEDLQMERQARTELLQANISTLLKVPKSTPSDVSFFDSIIAGICRIGIDLETKSPTYSLLSEEQIRDIFHTNLDIATGGRATRESFRKKGHTDIHVTNPDSTAETVVIEFKFWEGEDYYHKGIGQLLDYTTTRDKKCIFVTLNKKRNWKRIASKAKSAAKNYRQYVSNTIKPTELGNVDTAFWAEYDDDERTEPLKMCHILFNLNVRFDPRNRAA